MQPRDFDRSDEVLRRFDKIFRKDLEDSKKVVTFAARKEVSDGRDASERVLEVFELKRNLEKKIWRFQKKCLSLHHFPLKKRRSVQGRRRAGRSDRNPARIRNCSYSDIRTAFFEVIENLKFSTLEKE